MFKVSRIAAPMRLLPLFAREKVAEGRMRGDCTNLSVILTCLVLRHAILLSMEHLSRIRPVGHLLPSEDGRRLTAVWIFVECQTTGLLPPFVREKVAEGRMRGIDWYT